MRQIDLDAVHQNSDVVAFDPQRPDLETAPAVQRTIDLDLRMVSLESLEIADADQGRSSPGDETSSV